MSEQAGIDLIEFARAGKTLEGTVSYAQLGRLSDILAGADAGLHYTIQGRQDPRGRARIRVSVDGMVLVDCQRCLGRFEHRLDVVAETALAANEAEANALELEDEDLEVMVADGRYEAVSVVEEELLLALPFPPRHDEAQCGFRLSEQDAGVPQGRLAAALARELAKK